MGRGNDQDSTTPAISRKRNPFRQEIHTLDPKELQENRQEIAERERAAKLKAARSQKENIPVPDEAIKLETPQISPEEVLEKREEYLASEFSKAPATEPGFSPISLMTQVGGFIKEDYQVEISSSGGELQYEIRFPESKDHSGFLTREVNSNKTTGSFLPGEEEEAEKEINSLIEEHMTATRERAKKAFQIQERMQKLFSDQGVMSLDPNSPAYGLLDRVGTEIFTDSSLYSGTYPEKRFDHSRSGEESSVLGLFPEYYSFDTGWVLRGPGEAQYWVVRAPDGEEIASGNATGLRKDEVKAAADEAIALSVKESLEVVKEEHQRFKEREEIFAGLEARIPRNSNSSGGYINLASGNNRLKNLQRKELSDGWVAIVGEQNLRLPSPGVEGEKRDSELMLLFKDGKLQDQFTEGLRAYSDKAAGNIGRLLPGLRKRLLLQRAKRAIETSSSVSGS